jgi:hypothetical protein
MSYSVEAIKLSHRSGRWVAGGDICFAGAAYQDKDDKKESQ